MKLRHFVIIGIALCLSMVSIGKVVGQTGNLSKIDPELQELMHQSRDASERFRVIVEMTEQYNNPNLERGTAMMTRAQRREYVVNELKRFSEQSQAEMVRYLGQQSTRGQVNVLHRFWIFNGVCCEATAECIGELSMRRDVKHVILDKEMHAIEPIDELGDRSDPPEGVQWHVSKVRADEVWNSLGKTGAGVVVAVIDSGVNYNHQDISGNMWNKSTDPNYNPLYPNHGWDIFDNDSDPFDEAESGHGSHVAGIVASHGPVYQAGIAPGARIMAIKVGGWVNGEWVMGNANIICQAVEFALENGADVLNLSLGDDSGGGGEALVRTKFKNTLIAGVVATVASGNSGCVVCEGYHSAPYNIGSPGNCPPPWLNPTQSNVLPGETSAVICVGNVKDNDKRYYSSSFGPVTWAEGAYIGDYDDYPYEHGSNTNIGLIRPDVVAPGVSIWSIKKGVNDGYRTHSGTSMSSPCVAGVIALMLEANPNLTPEKIDEILETTAVPCENQTKKNNEYGAGRVDAFAAVSAAMGYNITVDVLPTGGGTVEGCGTYVGGNVCTLVATPNPGYIFKGWYLPSNQLMPLYTTPTIAFPVWSHHHLIAKFMAVTPTTDVYQYHCWFDQDYSTVQTGSFQTTETFFALDASALSEGIHTLHVMLDDNGLSAPKTYLFLKAPVVSPVTSYNYHCWFDQDYNTVQTGTFGGGGFSFALDASGLEEGIHTMHVMLEGNDLTAAKAYVFLKAPVTSPTSTYTYHCWFDQDYETVQTGSFGGEGYSFALDASELDEGIHTMHVMLEGNDLTAAKTYLFLKAPVASPNSTYTYHCWFDQDYETVQTGTFGGEGYSFALDASELDNGLHFVNVMLEGNELTSAKRYLFCKKPAGDGGIYRWEYCINGNWSDAVATTFVPTIQTLDIQTMLPVDPLPIRSESFEFEVNGGQPEIYAKNTITFRFWDAENRFLDRSAVYVDANVHEPVVAEWIERNTTKTIVTPGPNQIHWFKLDANVGDLLEFMADHECTIQLFSPSGEQVFASMSVASIVFNGTYARENGIYYLAVHDVESGYDNTSVSYRYSGLATQSVALAQGWNWWAPTVNASLSQLEEALGTSGISILSQSGSANNNNGQWSGTLESVTFGKMYKIRTAAVCSFTLTGLRPASVELSIAPGLNWFGFIGTAPTAIGTALNITPATGDKVISQDNGFAVYNGSSWEGTLTHLQPNCGYLYFSISSQPKTLIMGQ